MLRNQRCITGRERDLGGISIGQSTGFSVGVGGNPTAPGLGGEFVRFRYKVEAVPAAGTSGAEARRTVSPVRQNAWPKGAKGLWREQGEWRRFNKQRVLV